MINNNIQFLLAQQNNFCFLHCKLLFRYTAHNSIYKQIVIKVKKKLNKTE